MKHLVFIIASIAAAQPVTLTFAPQPMRLTRAQFSGVPVHVWMVSACSAEERSISTGMIFQAAVRGGVTPFDTGLAMAMIQQRQRRSWQATALRIGGLATLLATSLMASGTIAASSQFRTGAAIGVPVLQIGGEYLRGEAPRVPAEVAQSMLRDRLRIHSGDCAQAMFFASNAGKAFTVEVQ